MAMWLLNAFSAKMLGEVPVKVLFSELTPEKARVQLTADDFRSAVGHSATAQVLSERLALQVETNRCDVHLWPGQSAIVAQVDLPRLGEGEVLTTEQVWAAPIRFIRVDVEPVSAEEIRLAKIRRDELP